MEKAPRRLCLLFEGLYMLLLVPGTVGTVWLWYEELYVQVQKGAKGSANELKQCLLLHF